MVTDDLGKGVVDHMRESYASSGSVVPGLISEPSFSRWSGENSTNHMKEREGSNVLTIEEFEFELPIPHLQNGLLGEEKQLHGGPIPGTMHVNGIHETADAPRTSEGSTSENYASFDIETPSPTKRRLLHNDGDGDGDGDGGGDKDGSTSFANHKVSSQSSDTFSAANVLKTLFFILVWYTFSTFLTLYNKTLLGDDMGKFPAPLLMNTVHFTMQAVLSQAIVWYRCKRHETAVKMSWRDFCSRVVPTALATAMDVNLSNASLVLISVTFATMCKSAAPIFLLLFAFAFRLESPSIKLLGIMSIISVGILLTVAKDTEFELWGFILVTLAAVMSGFRWCMTQILLQKEDYGLKDPITFMSTVTPVMAVATGVLSLFLDPWQEFRRNNYFNNEWHVLRSCLLMLLGGALAFFMVLTEYILVSVTSAVTVTIAGVVKEAVTILVAVFYFHDEFTWMKGFGLLTIMIGVSLFNWYKYQKLNKGQSCEVQEEGLTRRNAAPKYVILEEMEEQEDHP